MPERLTIKEFAALSGVSIATVSRAFGGRGRISAATKARILEAAEKYGYRANFHARGLSSGDGGGICFFYPEIYQDEPDYFINEIIFGVTKSFSAERVLKMSPSSGDGEAALASCREQVLDGRIVGALILAEAPASGAMAELARAQKIPYVIVGDLQGFDFNSVRYDKAHGAYLAGRYFRNIGRRRAAYVSGYLDESKRVGFIRGFEGEVVELPGGAGFRYGVQALSAILKHPRRIDCVLCANDIAAVGLLHASAERGIKVPRDLAVIGFDDIAISRYFNPAISTVSLHLQEIGCLAVKMLNRQFAGEQEIQSEIVRCDLILRQSS